MKKKRIFIPIVVTLLIGLTVLFAIKYKDKPIVVETPEKGYIASDEKEVVLYDNEFNEIPAEIVIALVFAVYRFD